ncbi:class I SAM-dependent methyltransferase [Paracoccaceae bacterium]|nr:class I SAM-dependent methyltransferase [Paracoccaceae bacterium]
MENKIWGNYRKSIVQGDEEFYISLHEKDMEVVSQRISNCVDHDVVKKCVDVGCGPGELLSKLKSKLHDNVEFIGVDISASQIEEAKLRYSDIEFYLQDGSDFLETLPDNSISLITCVDVLEHLSLPDLLRMAGTAKAKLKPGGYMFIRVPNGIAPMNPIVYGDLTHQRAYTPQSLNQLAQMSGLEVLQIDGQYFEGKSKFGILRSLIMKFILYPIISLILIALYGNRCGRHYSANLYAVFAKR